jgi:hypothetical protein
MYLAEGGAPVAVKRRAMNRSTKVFIIFLFGGVGLNPH